ncbi:MAG: ABC transporter substrate-binding protein [Deltaproteobacteria bacterium]|nr:ABC transporter substrate-binding protein [Deltaproteobacteria bacterium]
MLKARHIIALTVTLFVVSSGVAAAQASPTAFVKAMDGRLKPLLADTKANESKILSVVDDLLDFETLCRDSLGKHWGTRSEAERKEFVGTLQALIEKSVVTRLKDTRNHMVTYTSEELNGNDATVVTVVAAGSGPRDSKTEIAYRLRKHGREWIVVDMVTDGVSLVSNYRSQFNKIIVEQGWTALMQKMKDKLAQ